MRLIRWMEGRWSGRRTKTPQPCACSPADQDFIFHPSPFRQPRHCPPSAFEQQFEKPHPSSPSLHSRPRLKLPAADAHHIPLDALLTPPVRSRSSALDSSRRGRSHRLPLCTPLTTPVSRPHPVTPITDTKVSRTPSKRRSTLDDPVFQSFYSPAHLVHGAALRQKLQQIEARELSSFGKKLNRLRANLIESANDQKVIHSSLSTDSSCLEPASRCDVTEKRSLSNRKSNFSDQDGTFFQSGSSVVTNDHSLLQSSISIDSGCPFTTNGSTSLMESSMQSSLMSDCFSMADSSSSPSFLNHQLNQDSMIINRSSSVSFCSSLSRPPCVALPPQFHDSELNLNQSKSFDFAPHYDQAALDHKRFVHHLDHSRLSIDQGEEQVLMVDEFGAVHQFTSQPFTLRSADEPQSIVRVPPPSYQSFLESRNDLRNLLPNDATRTGTRRIERRNNNIRSLVSNHASAQYNHENSASQHRVAAKQFATVSEGASATLGDDDNYQNRHTNNGSKRVEAKQEQLRRVMEFVLVSSSGLSSRNRTPIAGRSSALGGRSLFKGLQQSSRVRSGVANEAWVPCATDQFTRHMQGNPMSPTSSNAPNIDLLLQRQKQLHLQLKALARDCCSLTPNASATNNRCQQSKSIGSTLGANCVTSNSSDDVLIRSNDAESKQTLKNDAAGHNDSSGHSALTSQADSGIAELHCNDSGHTSDTSSPSFDQSPAVSASHNCSQNSKGDLATRIEQLRAELQSVVKVAIDQIRHIQSSSPSVSSVSSASLSCSSSSN